MASIWQLHCTENASLALYRECNHGAHIMHGLRKLIQSLSDLPDEQPIEPDLKTTKNKERDREIK